MTRIFMILLHALQPVAFRVLISLYCNAVMLILVGLFRIGKTTMLLMILIDDAMHNYLFRLFRRYDSNVRHGLSR